MPISSPQPWPPKPQPAFVMKHDVVFVRSPVGWLKERGSDESSRFTGAGGSASRDMMKWIVKEERESLVHDSFLTHIHLSSTTTTVASAATKGAHVVS